MNISTILLAAGASKRLGKPKQLILKNNELLINRQLRLLRRVSQHCVCVVGARAKQVIAKISVNTIVISENRKWQEGMASSIKQGLSSLDTETDAVMILLVDQWRIELEHLTALIALAKSNPDAIVCCHQVLQNQKQYSPPVIFPRQYIKELQQVTGEQGAKKVIINHLDKVVSLECVNAFCDIDTPAQLDDYLDCL